MNLKLFRVLALLPLAVGLLAVTTMAQSNNEAKAEERQAQPTRRYSVKLFEVKHRSPSNLRNALYTLGSGAGGSEIVANDQLSTLTVRDYPENINAIEEALKRLDVPDRSPVSLEFQLHLVAASMAPAEKPNLPKNLEPVLAQLKSTLKFTNYRYVSSALNRVSSGGQIESSGVTGSLFPVPSGVASTPDNPSFYQYSLSKVSLTQDASARESIQIDRFRFGVSVPIKMAGNQTQYRDIGIVTPLSLREGETAVVGTANIGGSDEAIIVIIAVKKVQ